MPPRKPRMKLVRQEQAAKAQLTAFNRDPSQSQAEWLWVTGLPADAIGDETLCLTHVEPMMRGLLLDIEFAQVKKQALGAMWQHSTLNTDWMTFSPAHVAARMPTTSDRDSQADLAFRKATVKTAGHVGLSGASMSIDDDNQLAPVFDALAEHLSIYESLAREGIKRMKSDLRDRKGEKSIESLSLATVNLADPEFAKDCPKEYQQKIVGYQGDIIKVGIAVSQLRRISSMAGDFIKSALASIDKEVDEVDNLAARSGHEDTEWLGDAARLRALNKLTARYWDSLVKITNGMQSLEELADDFAAWQVAQLQWGSVVKATEATEKKQAGQLSTQKAVKGAKKPKRKTAERGTKQLIQMTDHTRGMFTATTEHKQTIEKKLYDQCVEAREQKMEAWIDGPLLRDIMDTICRDDIHKAHLGLEDSLASQRGKPEAWRDMTILELCEFAKEKLKERQNHVSLSQQVTSRLAETASGWTRALVSSLSGLLPRATPAGGARPDPEEASDRNDELASDQEWASAEDPDGDSESEGENDDRLYHDAAELLPGPNGKYDLSKITDPDEPGWTTVKYDRGATPKSAEARRKQYVVELVNDVLGAPYVYKPPKVAAPSTVHSVQYNHDPPVPNTKGSAQSLKDESALLAARAQNLAKRSWAETVTPLSNSDRRDRLTNLQDRVISTQEEAYAADRRELRTLREEQSRRIRALQDQWWKERRAFAKDSGWMMLSSRWLGWFPDDEETVAPATLQGTDQAGYAFPTEAEKRGVYDIQSPHSEETETQSKLGSLSRPSSTEGPSQCQTLTSRRRANSL